MMSYHPLLLSSKIRKRKERENQVKRNSRKDIGKRTSKIILELYIQVT